MLPSTGLPKVIQVLSASQSQVQGNRTGTPAWCLQKALQGRWDILQDSVSHIILPSSSSAGPLITPSQALKIGLLARDGAIALDLPTEHWQVLRHAG
jgi:hypothetical protein